MAKFKIPSPVDPSAFAGDADHLEVKYGLPRSLPGGIGQYLLHHHHAAEFDRSQHEQYEYRRHDGKFDNLGAAPISSSSPALLCRVSARTTFHLGR